MTKEEFDLRIEKFFLEDNSYYYNSPENTFYWEWSNGGMSGGSCWGDEAESFFGDSPPDETPLDKFLEQNLPNIPLSVYKKISSQVTSGSRSNNEYYGNYEDFSTCSIHKDKLYDLLKEYKCV